MTNRGTSADEHSGRPAPCKHSAGKFRPDLPKSERLRARRGFAVLFRRRRSFNAGCLWVVYTFDLPAELVTAPLMVAFAVPKRTFKKAVTRNLLKRRMREAYRLNKREAWEAYCEKGENIAFLIKYNTKEIRSFKEIEKDMRYAFRRLTELI